ncbi:MAG TPA: hypothetical protein VHY58_12540 [Streptosporangiaceae bacterium]|jgi:hypothetical protein|nr:hypothetical protein [Streptosporangiaceae bacterium]
MRKKLAIGAMALAAAAVAGCSSGSSAHDTSAASTPSPAATTGPATGTAACNAINSTLNTIMGGAAKATPATGQTKQQAMQAKLAVNFGQNAQAFTDDQAQQGITPTLKQAEQVIAANAHTYAASYSKPDSGTYGLKIINALNQVKQQCGVASWQTAI